MWNLQTNCGVKLGFQNVEQHTGGQWLIHSIGTTRTIICKPWITREEHIDEKLFRLAKDSCQIQYSTTMSQNNDNDNNNSNNNRNNNNRTIIIVIMIIIILILILKMIMIKITIMILIMIITMRIYNTQTYPAQGCSMRSQISLCKWEIIKISL